MLNVKFYEDTEDGLLRFAVIAARYMDQWILSGNSAETVSSDLGPWRGMI